MIFRNFKINQWYRPTFGKNSKKINFFALSFFHLIYTKFNSKNSDRIRFFIFKANKKKFAKNIRYLSIFYIIACQLVLYVACNYKAYICMQENTKYYVTLNLILLSENDFTRAYISTNKEQ